MSLFVFVLKSFLLFRFGKGFCVNNNNIERHCAFGIAAGKRRGIRQVIIHDVKWKRKSIVVFSGEEFIVLVFWNFARRNRFVWTQSGHAGLFICILRRARNI